MQKAHVTEQLIWTLFGDGAQGTGGRVEGLGFMVHGSVSEHRGIVAAGSVVITEEVLNPQP